MFEINIVRDMTIYDPVVDPVVEELVSRKVKFVESRPSAILGKPYYLCIQKGKKVGTANITDGKIFFINHGLSCIKGWGTPDEVNCFFAPTEYWADKVTKWSTEKGLDRVAYVTGWPKMDLYYKNEQYRDRFRKVLFNRYTNGVEKKIVAIRPTYNEANNDHSKRKYSIKEMFDRISRAASDYLVLISRHQTETSELPTNLYDMQPASANIDVTIAADVVISDRSSIVFECAGMNKPVIMVDNPDVPGHLHLESQVALPLVDAGPHVTNDNIVDAIEHMIEEPMWYEDRRKYWGDFVAGPYDGNRSKCVVDLMLKYHEEHAS